MNKRKLRFNAIDAILIFAVAAVMFVLLYVFVFDKDNGTVSENPSKTIEYTILIQNQNADMLAGDTGGEQGFRDLIKYALIVVATAPILCLYPFLQRFFVKGVMVGALKG